MGFIPTAIDQKYEDKGWVSWPVTVTITVTPDMKEAGFLRLSVLAMVMPFIESPGRSKMTLVQYLLKDT